jgi:hypothetical protein
MPWVTSAAFTQVHAWGSTYSHDMAKGEYRMAGRTVIVTVTEKHWLLPWPLVEARLRELVL